MITVPTDCSWLLRVEGEAAEYVTSTLSLGAMNDIKEVVLISDEYSNDIQATISLMETVGHMTAHLDGEVNEKTTVNPLYVPSTAEQIDTVMEGSPGSEMVAFTGMDGSPYTIQMVTVCIGERNVISGKLSCHPFELPSYNEIIRNQANVRLQ